MGQLKPSACSEDAFFHTWHKMRKCHLSIHVIPLPYLFTCFWHVPLHTSPPPHLHLFSTTAESLPIWLMTGRYHQCPWQWQSRCSKPVLPKRQGAWEFPGHDSNSGCLGISLRECFPNKCPGDVNGLQMTILWIAMLEYIGWMNFTFAYLFVYRSLRKLVEVMRKGDPQNRPLPPPLTIHSFSLCSYLS